MKDKKFYKHLLEEILDERMRQEPLLPKIKRDNNAWLRILATKLHAMAGEMIEGLSWEIIRGRLIQCVAVIFVWIEDKDK